MTLILHSTESLPARRAEPRDEPGRLEATRPSLVLLASFLVPGLGSIINGDVRKGVGILAGFVVSALLSVILLGIIGMFGFWLWGLIDAYDGATGWDPADAPV